MKDYYLVVKFFGHPINNWGYNIIEVDRVNNFKEKIVSKNMQCGQYSPKEAVEKGGIELAIFLQN